MVTAVPPAAVNSVPASRENRRSRNARSTEIIIPGYAAAIAGDVEEELPGWTITVGPREAAHIPGFLKSK